MTMAAGGLSKRGGWLGLIPVRCLSGACPVPVSDPCFPLALAYQHGHGKALWLHPWLGLHRQPCDLTKPATSLAIYQRPQWRGNAVPPSLLVLHCCHTHTYMGRHLHLHLHFSLVHLLNCSLAHLLCACACACASTYYIYLSVYLLSNNL